MKDISYSYKKAPTAFQRQIAQSLNLEIEGMNNRVAAAIIEEYVFKAINPQKELKKASQKQIDFARNLGLGVSNNDTSILVSAKIEDTLFQRNFEALEKLDIESGDTVVIEKCYDGNCWEEVNVVSSISKDLRIFFKGIGCKGGWPTEIKRVIKK